jgi:hypothetical protein
MADIYGDFETFLLDNDNRIYSYLVYKRMFTPYEKQKAFMDESQFEDGAHFITAIIREAIPLGNGDWLLGLENIFEDEMPDDEAPLIEYFRLSEIRLMYYPHIEQKLKETWLEDESIGLLLDTSKSLDEIVREFEKMGIKVKDDNELAKEFA